MFPDDNDKNEDVLRIIRFGAALKVKVEEKVLIYRGVFQKNNGNCARFLRSCMTLNSVPGMLTFTRFLFLISFLTLDSCLFFPLYHFHFFFFVPFPISLFSSFSIFTFSFSLARNGSVMVNDVVLTRQTRVEGSCEPWKYLLSFAADILFRST